MTQYDRDPACWAWPLPADRDRDPWVMLADWCDDRCPLCGGRQGTSPALDHDHQTGLVRGWTCRRCNQLEGYDGEPRSMWARWRACPATAVLDLLLPYPGAWGVKDGDIEEWTGPTFLPETAPDAGRWPHAITCAEPPELVRQVPGVRYGCGHPHIERMAAAFRAPMSDGGELLVRAPRRPEDTRAAMMDQVSAALGDALTRKDGDDA